MGPTLALPMLLALIAVALAFDFLNGLHDAANSIATVVSTRVLSPQMAVLWAATFNFVAFLFIGLHVAETIGKGIVDPAILPGRSCGTWSRGISASPRAAATRWSAAWWAPERRKPALGRSSLPV